MNPAAVSAKGHVFVDALDDTVRITGPDGNHLARSLRVRAGQTLTAADGRGAWRIYDVVEAVGGEVQLVATSARKEELERAPRLAVAFALTKGNKPETTVTHLTELGVDRIIPVLMERSIVVWDAAKRAAAGDRFATAVREAGMQCRRARLPVIEPVATLAEVLAHPALVVGDASSTPVADVFDRLGADTATVPEWCAVVGPEGGFAPDERAALLAASPYPPVAIGSYVLRAETAALALATALSVLR